jgi:hypothetical protein
LVEDRVKTQDLEASFALFSQDDAQDVRNARNSDLQVSYHYPSSSRSFNKSFVSSIEGCESQHLLSPTKISRLDRIVSRSNHNNCETRDNRTPLSRYRALNSNAGIQLVNNEVKPEDDLDKTPKARSRQFLMRSLYSSPPKGMNTKVIDKSHDDSSSTNNPKPKNAMIELQSMISRFGTVDLTSSIATMDDHTAATAEDSSLNLYSSYKLKFDPQHRLDDARSSAEGYIGSIRQDSLLQDMQKEEIEEGQPKNKPEERAEAVENQQGAIDDELCTISLLEHILLVADVGHTLQHWDSMLKWSFRLSQEMKLAIATGRGCDIPNQTEDEEFRSWYTNQISFLEGYVLPLAMRLEQTGFLPMTTVILNPVRIGCGPHHPDPQYRENVHFHDGRQEVQPSTFLTEAAFGNCRRWKEQGMDVLFEWRKKAVKNNVPPSQESAHSINGWLHNNGDNPWHALRGDFQTIRDQNSSGMSMINVDECCPSRG